MSNDFEQLYHSSMLDVFFVISHMYELNIMTVEDNGLVMFFVVTQKKEEC